jgi:hypothetical protein
VPFDVGPNLIYVGSGQYKTVGETVYVGATEVIRVPSDMPTDLASVPRIAWAILPPHGVWERSAVVHDYGCRQLADGTCALSSVDVDGLFRRIIREDQQTRHAGPLRRCLDLVVRWILWTGVRWGALFNPARRAGWLAPRSVLPTVGITAALLALVCAVLYGLDRAAHWII